MDKGGPKYILKDVTEIKYVDTIRARRVTYPKRNRKDQ
jgi:hypothetical protein